MRCCAGSSGLSIGGSARMSKAQWSYPPDFTSGYVGAASLFSARKMSMDVRGAPRYQRPLVVDTVHSMPAPTTWWTQFVMGAGRSEALASSRSGGVAKSPGTVEQYGTQVPNPTPDNRRIRANGERHTVPYRSTVLEISSDPERRVAPRTDTDPWSHFTRRGGEARFGRRQQALLFGATLVHASKVICPSQLPTGDAELAARWGWLKRGVNLLRHPRVPTSKPA